MPREIRPRAVFERVFGTGEIEPDPARRARLEKYQKRILEVVLSDAQRLKGTLGGADRRKLDEYMFAIRDIEKRIHKAERENAQAWPKRAESAARVSTGF